MRSIPLVRHFPRFQIGALDTEMTGFRGRKSFALEKVYEHFNGVHRQSNSGPMVAKKIAQSKSNDYPQLERFFKPLKRFITGSTYVGQWDCLGMTGSGVYTMPNNVVYEGQMQDGHFHGNGILRYADGSRIEGVWSMGHMVRSKFFFSDSIANQTTDPSFNVE